MMKRKLWMMETFSYHSDFVICYSLSITQPAFWQVRPDVLWKWVFQMTRFDTVVTSNKSWNWKEELCALYHAQEVSLFLNQLMKRMQGSCNYPWEEKVADTSKVPMKKLIKIIINHLVTAELTGVSQCQQSYLCEFVDYQLRHKNNKKMGLVLVSRNTSELVRRG